MSTRTTDKGKKEFDQFRKTLAKINRGWVTIGIHDDAGVYSHPNGTSIPLATVALIHEFGSENAHIPERSYVRSAIDENAELLNRWRREMIDNAMNKGWSADRCLETLGYRVQELVRNKIKSNVPPPLTEEYRVWKLAQGFTEDTLVATKRLMNAITFKVHYR